MSIRILYFALYNADIHNNICIFVLGCLFIFFIYHISIILEKKEPAIIYYSFYVLFLMIYFSFKLDFEQRSDWYAGIARILNYPIQPLIWAFYILFNRKILNLKEEIPKLDAIVKVVSWSLLGVSVLFFALRYMIAYESYRTIVALFGVLSILVAFVINFIIFNKIKSKIAIYYVVGSTIFLVSSSIAFYLTAEGKFDTTLSPVNYMQIGSIIEIFMFSLIIAYKIKIDKEKKEELELLYSQKLNEIDALKSKIAYSLEMNKADNGHIQLEDLNNISKNKLTKREFEILKLVSQGFNNQDIAEKLFISLNTVKFHLKNIYDKLDVNNRIQASQFFNQI